MVEQNTLTLPIAEETEQRWESHIRDRTPFRTMSDFVQYCVNREVHASETGDPTDVLRRIEETEVSSDSYAVCFVADEDRTLLVERRDGPVEGFHEGPAEQCQAEETPEDCAVRGVTETLGVTPEGPVKTGEIVCTLNGEPNYHEHMFRSTSFSGQPEVSSEGWPRWVSLETLPYSKMWMDDRIWLPLVLKERKFAAWFDYEGPDNWWDASLVDFEIERGVEFS